MEKSKVQPIEKMDYLSLGEYIVRSSISLVTLNPTTKMPYNWGTGFMLRYRERHFLVTIYHVIKFDQNNMYIQLGKDQTGQAILQPLSGLHSFSKSYSRMQTNPKP